MVPLKPELPLVPELPDVPLVPELPEVPLVPELPEVPLVPELPEVPLEPDVPSVPDEPLVPELPLVPEEPLLTVTVGVNCVALAQFLPSSLLRQLTLVVDQIPTVTVLAPVVVKLYYINPAYRPVAAPLWLTPPAAIKYSLPGINVPLS